MTGDFSNTFKKLKSKHYQSSHVFSSSNDVTKRTFLDQEGLSYLWQNKIKPLYNKADKSQFFSATASQSETDIEAIDRVTQGKTLQQGDICVVKRLIATSKYSYTGYVYDGSNWGAMDGNYSAENVYFSNDIVLAGNYTQVGNITKNQSETSTLAAEGKSVKELFNSIFTKELMPTVTQPTFSISSSNIGAYEAGTKIRVNYTLNTTSGSYSYGPSTDVTFGDYTAIFNGETKTDKSGDFSEIQVTDSTSFKINATAKSSLGAIPLSNIGNPCESYRIQAKDDWSKEYGTLTGYRNWFWGYKTQSTLIPYPEEITSTQVRGLGNSANSNATISTKEIITTGMQQIFVAIPHSIGKTNVAIVNKQNGAPQTVYKKSDVLLITGANEYSAIDYDVWYVNNLAPDSQTNTYVITIS